MTEIEELKNKNQKIISYMRKWFGWCAGCKNFRGLEGCLKGDMKNCTSKNDLYEWGDE